MTGFTSWLKQNLSSFEPDEHMTLNATRHLGKLERSRLFSPEIDKMRTAEGRWYESIIYEMFLAMAPESDQIRHLVLKGDDVPHRNRQRIRLGQNGLFYSRCGDITVRGNGQDLAEFDLLLFDDNDQVAFAEVVTSASDMKEFEKEIAYKRTLLGYLFDQKTVPFLLVSSFDVTNYVVGRRLLSTKPTINIQTSSCEELKSYIRPEKCKSDGKRHLDHGSLVLANDITLKNSFFYERYHEEERSKIMARIMSPSTDGKLPAVEQKTGQLVKKILYGGLYPSAIRTVCKEHDFLVRGELVGYPELMTRYSKAVLATDLPGYEPIVYLRQRNRKEYLKMVRNGDGNFKFERYTPPKVGFFFWLESLTPTLGGKVTRSLLEAFLANREKN
jgi:hypothetical protein